MKKINKVIYLFTFLSSQAFSQIYQPFIFIDNRPMVYDVPLQELAQKALTFYYFRTLDSSVYYYNLLLNKKPSYYQGYYNLARAYALKNDYKGTINALSNYVSNVKEECNCSFLTDVDSFKPYKDSVAFKAIVTKCCGSFLKYVLEKKITQPEKLLKITYLDGKEQEILGNDSLYKNRSEQIQQLKRNFAAFTQVIDTTNFPSAASIGKGIELIQLIVLHADYYPGIQFSLGQKLLSCSEEKGYNPKMAAYIIDRALRNMGKPQLYGTILLRNNAEVTLYNYDDLEKLKERRKKLNFQTVDEYLKNQSITQ